MSELLRVEGLHIAVEGKEILKGLDLTINTGETHVIMGSKLKMDKSYAERYVNDGFSGGERKKTEILQMCMLEPKLTMLDEIDSGLDVDAVRIVSETVSKYHNENNSILVITHHSEILQHLKPDFVHILIDGKIVKTGDASLIQAIEANGYDAYKG